MKLFRYLIPVLLFGVMSCGKEKPMQHFWLSINTANGTDSLQYNLTDSSLTVLDLPGKYEDRGAIVLFECTITDNDTLQLIPLLDIKAYDCKEQHALNATYIDFKNDSGFVEIDPNVNHPKEIDYAVRLINSLVPDKYKLEFIDMQPAIEPNGKMQI